MPRRTKLITLGIFLVLLAVPVAYVALTWTTSNPLRFHVVRYQHQGKSNHGDTAKVDLRVENGSDLPVHLFPSFDIGRSTAHGPEGVIYLERSGYILIPPRGSVSFSADVQYHSPEPRRSMEEFLLGYMWLSGTAYKTDQVRIWLQTHLPKPLSTRVPRVWQDYGLSVLELQDP